MSLQKMIKLRIQAVSEQGEFSHVKYETHAEYKARLLTAITKLSAEISTLYAVQSKDYDIYNRKLAQQESRQKQIEAQRALLTKDKDYNNDIDKRHTLIAEKNKLIQEVDSANIWHPIREKSKIEEKERQIKVLTQNIENKEKGLTRQATKLEKIDNEITKVISTHNQNVKKYILFSFSKECLETLSATIDTLDISDLRLKLAIRNATEQLDALDRCETIAALNAYINKDRSGGLKTFAQELLTENVRHIGTELDLPYFGLHGLENTEQPLSLWLGSPRTSTPLQRQRANSYTPTLAGARSGTPTAIRPATTTPKPTLAIFSGPNSASPSPPHSPRIIRPSVIRKGPNSAKHK